MSQRSPTVRTLLVSLLTAAVPALAAPAAAQEAGAIPFESYELDNGLRVILAPDRSTPVVTVDVWYDVGSRNERPGRSGFAHLFEHMMFQGSENVERGAHMTLIERAGGSMNGTTNEDRTNYFETLPANRLNLGLWLEADRMRSLAITKENFENQREVVKEERRLRIENSPYGSSFLAASYDAPYAESCFPYDHSVIGSMEDLNAAEVQDVQRFFDLYYAPNNATLTVVGDFDPAETRALIQEYFGGIPAGEAVPGVECEAPFSHLPYRTVIEDQNANLPAYFGSYGIPAVGDRDLYALQLLAAILGQGESSRLNQRLVKEEQAALQVFNFADVRRGPGIFLTGAIANQGVDAERLEALIAEEVERVRAEGVTAEELEKAKNQHRAQTIRSRLTAMGRAEDLQFYAHYYGDPAAIRNSLEPYMAVTLEDVQRVAREYLAPTNRAVVITEPVSAGEE
jgi:zinc protease